MKIKLNNTKTQFNVVGSTNIAFLIKSRMKQKKFKC